MSLNYELGEIHDWKNYCYVDSGDVDKKGNKLVKLNPLQVRYIGPVKSVLAICRRNPPRPSPA